MRKTNELIIMVGLPGAGKTTISKNYKEKGYVVHRSDDIRAELFGGEYNRDQNKKVFSVMQDRTFKDLKNDKDVVYDATNLSRKARRYLINHTKKLCGSIIGHVVYRDYEALIKYNKDRDFPLNVFYNYRRYFTLPNKTEGFDYIIHTLTNPEEINYYGLSDKKERQIIFDFILQSMKKNLNIKDHPFYGLIENYDQDNPNHTLTLDRHILKTYRQSLMFENKEVIIASLFHDVGKPLVPIKNKYGHTSYYGHENVSAYLTKMLFLKYNNIAPSLHINPDKIVTLISYHMRMHNTKTAKSKNKLMAEIGRDLYPHLCELFVSDLAGK